MSVRLRAKWFWFRVPLLQQLSNTRSKMFHSQIFFQLKYSPRKCFKAKFLTAFEKTENWTQQCNLFSIHIINYYRWRMVTWNTQQFLKDLLIISRYFTFFLSLLCYYFFSNSQTLMSIIYMAYHIHRVSEICIGGRFLENCFYCYSQQIISALAKEFLIPCNLTHKEPKTQNL